MLQIKSLKKILDKLQKRQLKKDDKEKNYVWENTLKKLNSDNWKKKKKKEKLS